MKKKKVSKFVYWTPRIISILFVLFLALSSLDAFSLEGTVWEKIGLLLLQNILTVVMLAVVIIAWKYEIVGCIGFLLAGIAYIIALLMNPKFEWYLLAWAIEFSGAAFFTAALFFMNWRAKKKQKRK